MNRLEKILSKCNFKKIARAYIIMALIAAIGCVAATGIVFRNRISFAWQYSRVSEALEKNKNTNLQDQIDKLAASSSDVIDILILDNNNNVTYSANNSEFGKGQLNLSRTGEEKNYLISDKSSNIVFKYVKGKEFMFDSVFNKDFGEIRSEYNEESFYKNNFSNKTVYMLSFLGGIDSSSKVYILSSPASVIGGMLTLKIDACIAMLFFMVYWVLLALWIFQDASKAKLYPLFWGVIVLLTNIAGVIVYTLYKRSNATCPSCGASQSKIHTYCSSCGIKIGATCGKCGMPLSTKDIFCPHCGSKIK